MAKKFTKKVASARLPHVKRETIDSVNVTLVKGRGSSDRGGGQGGFYWHIQVNERRAGYVFINMIEDTIFGVHPSIQIHINQSERGKQIGRVAYRLACEESGYETIYAHMRKNNIASKRAAEEAGFSVVNNDKITQLAMIWRLNRDNM